MLHAGTVPRPRWGWAGGHILGQAEAACSAHSTVCTLQAATHLSSLAEPLADLLKATGPIEASGFAPPHELRAAAASRTVTPALLLQTLAGWCAPSNYAVPEGALARETRRWLHAALPWAVRANPQRYPFHLPDNAVPFCCSRPKPISLSNPKAANSLAHCCYERTSCSARAGHQSPRARAQLSTAKGEGQGKASSEAKAKPAASAIASFLQWV